MLAQRWECIFRHALSPVSNPSVVQSVTTTASGTDSAWLHRTTFAFRYGTKIPKEGKAREVLAPSTGQRGSFRGWTRKLCDLSWCFCGEQTMDPSWWGSGPKAVGAVQVQGIRQKYSAVPCAAGHAGMCGNMGGPCVEPFDLPQASTVT